MTDESVYHEKELAIVRHLDHPDRLVPSFDCTGKTILDVGCGIGQTLTAIEFAACSKRYGIDIDAAAIAKGSAMFPDLQLQVARAEALPFPSEMFDLTYSRVAIPYTNLEKSMAEMIRVTKDGGIVWVLLHSVQMEYGELRAAVQKKSIRRLIDRFYVLANSIFFLLFWKCFARPWGGTFESWQFENNFRRFMESCGLHSVRRLSDTRFCMYGIKGPKPNV
jgi:ubiquinone/menaquinone biosynthesis C-methylase UbiE